MAELLVSGGLGAPNSLGTYLREALPDEYVVVTEPVLQRETYDAVVVGPGGLAVLEIVPDGDGTADKSRHKLSQREMAEHARRAAAALQAFTEDEFPALHPSVRYLCAVCEPDVDIVEWRAMEASGMSSETLAQTIISSEPPPDDALRDDEARESLGVALRDRQLTASEHAVKPFVFRSGNLLGVGKKSWTVRDAILYIDSHPDEGIYHLVNGTLERWLAAEGAQHLAQLAHDAMRQDKVDRRAALEIFLIGSGLVRRPKLSVRPGRVDLGYVLDGETAAHVVRLSKGRGRGYLFGKLSTSDSWLRVEPATFSGGPVEVLVSADTSNLPIGPDAQGAAIFVESSASEAPVSIPVRFRVVAMPSPLIRTVPRPLAGLTLTGLIGAGIGWLWALAGAPAPTSGIGVPFLGLVPAWAILVGLFWAVLGAVWGLFQPPAWPFRYAAGHLLVRTAIWAGALAAMAAILAGGWREGAAGGVLDLGVAPGLAALYAAAAAIIPGAAGEIAAGRAAKDPQAVQGRGGTLRTVIWGVAGVVLLLGAILLLPRFVRPAWESPQTQGALQSGGRLAADGFDRLNARTNELVDQLYLRYYDRRAPASASTPAPARRATPAPGGQPAGSQGTTP